MIGLTDQRIIALYRIVGYIIVVSFSFVDELIKTLINVSKTSLLYH